MSVAKMIHQTNNTAHTSCLETETEKKQRETEELGLCDLIVVTVPEGIFQMSYSAAAPWSCDSLRVVLCRVGCKGSVDLRLHGSCGPLGRDDAQTVDCLF